MTAHTWLQRPERGSVLGMKVLTWLSLRLGRRAARVLLYPVCAYFVAFSRGGRRASRQYLGKVLGRRASLRDVFRHHYVFAVTLLDRAFLYAGRQDLFEVTKHGDDVRAAVQANSRGYLLLGAHLGSFELARILGAKNRGLRINMMMYENNATKINRVIESLGGREQVKIIPIGGIDALLLAQERIDAGEALGILGDRVWGEKVVSVPFLGARARFPAGPFLIAKALKIPVALFFAVHTGGNRYEEHFELFADEIVIDRRGTQADLERWVGKYAARLEDYCRRYPYNWFNFFDFWEQPSMVREPAVKSAA